MRQLLLVLVGRIRRGTLATPCSRVLLGALAVLLAGCASHSLIPKDQAEAIKRRDRALAPHTAAIQAAIRQSGEAGGLAFLDATDARLVVLPGHTPAAAWARHTASPEGEAARVSVPPVVAFVYRDDVPAGPETVNSSALQEQQAFRASVSAFHSGTQDAQRRTEEQLREIQRQLEWLAAAKQDAERSLAAARGETQMALRALADELAAARAFMLQTAQLGWLNHDLNVENASSIRKLEATSQSLAETSARLVDATQQLSEGLARELKVLAERIEAIRTKMGEIK